MFCSKCGTELPKGAMFCISCGIPIANVEKGMSSLTAPDLVETSTTAAKVDNGRNEVAIHGYTGDFINMKIKVFRNGELVGTIGKGGQLTVRNDTDAVFLFKCAFRKAQRTVKVGSGELQLVWNKQSGRLNVFDLNDPNLGEEQEKLTKSENKWRKAIAILVGVTALVMLFAYFMSDGVNHQELVRYSNPYEDAGITATYERVIDKYFISPKWNERRGNEDIWYVDVSGKMTMDSEDLSIMLTFLVTPQGNKYLTNEFWIEPYSMDINGESHGTERASSFIAELFEAYDQGYESMNKYYESMISTVTPPLAENEDMSIAQNLYDDSDSGLENQYAIEILYGDVPVHSFLGDSTSDIIKKLGDPQGGYSGWGNDMFYLDYIGIAFGYDMADSSEEIVEINISPSEARVNGITLDKNRAELIDILGDPIWEGWADDGDDTYRMQYYTPYFTRIVMSDPNENAYLIQFYQQ